MTQRGAALMLACLVSCDGDVGNPSGTGATRSQSVSSAGGQLELEGATLIVPPGALLQGNTLTVTSRVEPADKQFESFSPVYEFNPAGTEFAMPVTIELKTSIAGGSQLALFWTKRGSTTEFEELESTVRANTVIATIQHFSRGFIGESRRRDGGVDAGKLDAGGSGGRDGGDFDGGAPPADGGVGGSGGAFDGGDTGGSNGRDGGAAGSGGRDGGGAGGSGGAFDGGGAGGSGGAFDGGGAGGTGGAFEDAGTP